jgi:hypothetical protein
MSEALTAELTQVAVDVAIDVEEYVETVEAVASGGAGSNAIALLLLNVARITATGAQLGATADVVLPDNVEPPIPPEPDVSPLREALAAVLDGVDHYAEVFDPYLSEPTVDCALSDDLAEIAADLLHGLRHYREGRPFEALWWWQYSYLNHWGNNAGAALRALQSVVAHVRLDSVEPEA